MGFWTKALAAVAFGIPGLVVACIIEDILSESTIREKVEDDGAFYGEIVAMQPNTVTIKEIDDDGDVMQHCKLESSDGVSDDLYEGMKIYA